VVFSNLTRVTSKQRYVDRDLILLRPNFTPHRCYHWKIYFNHLCIEKFDQAPAGKYTVGLGQKAMAFVGDREDINSICLTVVKNLFEKYNIDPASIGRLEVGTETILDKSKAVKTVLMDLLAEAGNYNVEGVDNKNACYGGTAALFNCIHWIESSSWDGRYALVVAGDIAVYAAGNARPTGGCGAVAMLIGPNAPIVFERGLRSTYMENAYDFYKPLPASEYPTVDGKLSIECYLRAVDHCYDGYTKRFFAVESRKWTFDDIDYIAFHAPYNKLVQKSFARLMYNDFLQNRHKPEYKDVQKFAEFVRSETYVNREIEEAFMKKSRPLYVKKVLPGVLLPQELGNTYCASLYAGLCSVLFNVGDNLIGKRIVLFSYGSGLAASMFSVKVTSSIRRITEKLDLKRRLAQRRFVEPSQFVKILEAHEKRYVSTSEWKATDPIDDLFPGTYYLEGVDKMYRRIYKRKPSNVSRL
jgi:hydroxymethylglutaryl-CoA synthase